MLHFGNTASQSTQFTLCETIYCEKCSRQCKFFARNGTKCESDPPLRFADQMPPAAAVAPMGKFDVGPSAAADRGPPNLPLPARHQADEFCQLGSLLAFPQFLITPPPVGVAEQARRQEMKWGVCVFFCKKSGKCGCFFVKSGPFLNAGCIVYAVSVFFILHFAYLVLQSIATRVSVCLSVCSLAYLQNYMPDLHCSVFTV